MLRRPVVLKPKLLRSSRKGNKSGSQRSVQSQTVFALQRKHCLERLWDWIQRIMVLPTTRPNPTRIVVAGARRKGSRVSAITWSFTVIMEMIILQIHRRRRIPETAGVDYAGVAQFSKFWRIKRSTRTWRQMWLVRNRHSSIFFCLRFSSSAMGATDNDDTLRDTIWKAVTWFRVCDKFYRWKPNI